jgi:hypothetical protein
VCFDWQNVRLTFFVPVEVSLFVERVVIKHPKAGCAHAAVVSPRLGERNNGGVRSLMGQ